MKRLMLVLMSTFLCVIDGELYTATVSNFQGNEPTIYRSLGTGTPLKTENSLNWLQGKYIQTHTLPHKGRSKRLISKNKCQHQ